MRKDIIEDNKARWEVFEWIGSTRAKVMWGAAAAVVVLAVIYLLS